MNKRKLTTGIVGGALAAAALALILMKRTEPVAQPTPEVAEKEAQRAADSMPARIEEAPRRTQDVFMPPPTDATGSSSTVNE